MGFSLSSILSTGNLQPVTAFGNGTIQGGFNNIQPVTGGNLSGGLTTLPVTGNGQGTLINVNGQPINSGTITNGTGATGTGTGNAGTGTGTGTTNTNTVTPTTDTTTTNNPATSKTTGFKPGLIWAIVLAVVAIGGTVAYFALKKGK